MGERNLIPVLLYLFRRFERTLTGQPAYLLLDEAWRMLGHPVCSATASVVSVNQDEVLRPRLCSRRRFVASLVASVAAAPPGMPPRRYSVVPTSAGMAGRSTHTPSSVGPPLTALLAHINPRKSGAPHWCHTPSSPGPQDCLSPKPRRAPITIDPPPPGRSPRVK